MQEQQHSQPNISTRKVHRTAVHRLFLALLLANAAQADDVEPSAGPIAFRIEPQSLDTALVEFSAASGQQVAVDGKLSTGVRSPGVSGSYTPRQALDELLAGTGVAARVGRNGTVTLEKAKAAEPQSMAVALPKVTVSDTAASERYDSNNPYDKNYAVPDSFAATKTDTPIIETPFSVQVVPKALMQDQQAFTLQETLKNVSGVRLADMSGGDDEGFIIRGFSVNRETFRNGQLVPVSLFDTANLERLEVLKGPGAVLYGRSQPGGLINFVSKKPLADPYYSVQQQFGSYDLYRTTADATGPITDDKSLLYRFNLAYQSNNSFRDYVSLDRIFIAPSFTWHITDDTEWTVDFEYKHDDFTLDNGIPAIGNRPAPLPRNRYLGDPNISTKSENERKLVQSTLSHRFNEDWKLTNRFVAAFTDYFQIDINSNRSIRTDNRTLDRSFLYVAPQFRDIYGTNFDLTGHFTTGPLDHKTLVGFDFYRFDQAIADGGGRNYTSLPGTLNDLLPIDIYNPVYGQLPLDALTALPRNYFFKFQQTWYGLYFQDEITLWDKLHILGGGRQDWAETASGFSTISDQTADQLFNRNKTRVQYFSPRVGVAYNPWRWLSLYGNYMEGFGNNNGLAADGNPFSPETSQSYEVGFKTELFDKRLTTNVAFYNLTKQNSLVVDPANPNFSAAIGEARSRGIEVDITGQVTEGLSLIATYALTDAEITKDIGKATVAERTVITPRNTGNRLLNVPLHSGSLWAKYAFQSAPLQGLSLGGGVYLASQREGDVTNTFQLPGYGRVDLFAAYKFKLGPTQLTTQVNVNNLTDNDYFLNSVSRGRTVYGAPRTFLGSIRLEY